MSQIRREAMRQGREAALAQLRGHHPPACPHRAGTRRHDWWQDGAARTTRLLGRIMEIGG